MKILIISYSLSGNNRLLARHVAEMLNAEWEEIQATRDMSIMALAFDALFNRKPPIAPQSKNPADYDVVILTGPIWMGKIASPLRSYVKIHKNEIKEAAFLSICGGALGKNPKVEMQLKKMTGMSPKAVKQLYISDLLPEDKRNDSAATSAYTVSENDLRTNWDSGIRDFLSSIGQP